MKELVFESVALKEVPVKIGDKEYVLREASGEAARRYRNKTLESTILGSDGKPAGVKGLADAEPFLVSLCLFDPAAASAAHPNGNLVSLGTITSWPARIQKALYNAIKEMSDLDETEESLEELLQQRAKLDKRIEALQKGEPKNADTTEMPDGSA